jgi:predicted dehydrogenase
MIEIENAVLQDKHVIPLVGFIGTGWIGLNRMNAIAKENMIIIDAIADSDKDNLMRAQESIPDAKVFESIEELLDNNTGLSGVVIATPSALHADQAIYALEKGMAVFCQKPLGRTAQETKSVVEAAQNNNKLLGVDFSYRFTEGMQKIYHLIKSETIGKIFAINLVFHNAYGPDKKWFYDARLSGGGCVIDLGSHLIDLALWILDFPAIVHVSSSLFSNGKPIVYPETETEDFAQATIETHTGTTIQLSCSWNLHAGQDALVEATFHGTHGGASFKNTNGSFYDFEAHRFYLKTKKEVLATPPDKWGGKAIIDWARRLAGGEGFNNDAHQFIKVAEVIDRIYKRKME